MRIFIVPPPDAGIDIFIEETDKDNSIYHAVQVKNSILAENKIRECFSEMKIV